jgi:hypothetical protein
MDTWIWVVIVVAAVVVLVAVAYAMAQRRRRQELRRSFGSEYDHALEDAGSRSEAESELRERLRRHDELELRPLDPELRDRYEREWESVQNRFVDDPRGAIGDADGLIRDVMRARGYPVEDFDQRAADLSVDHPDVVENYRAAEEISRRSVQVEASTEDMRRAVVHYRALFADMLAADRDRVEVGR